jgi:hypothetical protein
LSSADGSRPIKALRIFEKSLSRMLGCSDVKGIEHHSLKEHSNMPRTHTTESAEYARLTALAISPEDKACKREIFTRLTQDLAARLAERSLIPPQVDPQLASYLQTIAQALIAN